MIACKFCFDSYSSAWYIEKNFVKKKRKSRSRGSSARRNQNKNVGTLNTKTDLCSSTIDATLESISSKAAQEEKSRTIDASKTGPCCSRSSEETTAKEASILSLAESVATAAIATAERDLKNSSQNNYQQKDSFWLKKSSQTTMEANKSGQSGSHRSDSSDMIENEEKINSLCSLLEQLTSTYGSSGVSKSLLKEDKLAEMKDKGGKKNEVNKKVFLHLQNGTNSEMKDRGKKNELNKEVFFHQQKETNVIANSVEKKKNWTQEEKQALRKAKKETKKATPLVTNLGHTSPPTIEPKQKMDQTQNEPKQKTEQTQNEMSKNDLAGSEKSKADQRRERREKQEAQRAAKKVALTKLETKKSKVEPLKKSKNVKIVSKKKETLISDRHLPLLEHLSAPKTEQHNVLINNYAIHPAFRVIGLSMREQTIDGCISRVIATLSAIYSLIEDYQTPISCDLSRDLSNLVSSNINFLNGCRPISEPMNNAIRFVKREVNKVPSSTPELQAKEELLGSIDTYIHHNIVLASEAVIQNALEFLDDSDVILTYGFSALVYDTLKECVKQREKLSVVVVDNPGLPSGANFLQDLVDLGVKVFYRILPDLAHVINKVTKVVVEAEAVVLNGAVIGRCGLAGLILLASNHSVPVIVLSHTFKFCNIDLTDSLVVNELGDSSCIVDSRPSSSHKNLLSGWKDISALNVVNLIYDVTPASLINVLVTERNNFPTSVVPVIIKRNFADILGPD